MEKNISKYFVSAADLLQQRDVPAYDFHIHTNYTDGKATVREVIEKAIEFKLEAICFTEHTETWHHTDEKWFGKYFKEISKIRGEYSDKLQIFIGVEVPVVSFNGDLEVTSEMLEKVDFVLGAAHRYPEMEGRKVKELSATEAIDLEVRTLESCLQNPNVDAIAHIGATCSKYVVKFPEALTRQIIRKATKKGIAVEINPVYHKPLISFLEICAEENAMISLGSNAHGFNDVGYIVKELKKELNND